MSNTGPTASGVRVTQRRVGWLARLATINRLPDPTKCLLVSGLSMPFMLGWVVRLGTIQANPDSAPYVSRAFLPTMLAYEWVQLLGHVFIMAAALYLRARGRVRVRWLVHFEIQWWLACFAFSFYALGPFTSPFGVLLLVLPVAGSVIFPARPMVYGFVALGVYSALMIGLERAGVIPYAPFLERPPFEDGRLVNSWIVALGFPAIFAAMFVLAAHSWIVAQWRQRERELEVLIGTDPLTGVANRRVFFERRHAVVLVGERQAQQPRDPVPDLERVPLAQLTGQLRIQRRRAQPQPQRGAHLFGLHHGRQDAGRCGGRLGSRHAALQHAHREPGLRQTQRGGAPHDAPAHDDDVRRAQAQSPMIFAVV